MTFFLELFGAFILIGLLTFGIRSKLMKYGHGKATFIAAGISVALALVVSTLTGMGPARFVLYPLSGLLVIPVIFWKHKPKRSN